MRSSLREKTHERIPKGVYCYDENGVCPFWSRIALAPTIDSGYCSFLARSDAEVGFGLLWDQVKECGVNREHEESDFNPQS